MPHLHSLATQTMFSLGTLRNRFACHLWKLKDCLSLRPYFTTWSALLFVFVYTIYLSRAFDANRHECLTRHYFLWFMTFILCPSTMESNMHKMDEWLTDFRNTGKAVLKFKLSEKRTCINVLSELMEPQRKRTFTDVENLKREKISSNGNQLEMYSELCHGKVFRAVFIAAAAAATAAIHEIKLFFLPCMQT